MASDFACIQKLSAASLLPQLTYIASLPARLPKALDDLAGVDPKVPINSWISCEPNFEVMTIAAFL